jgi:hypothetical protein
MSSEGDWESSFQRRTHLSPEEARSLVLLQARVSELRYLSSEYLLRRASFSDTKSEKVGWWSIWALTRFVESHHRFPRQGELYPYLHKVMDESKTLEELQLPPLDLNQVKELQTCQMTHLQAQQASLNALSTRLSTLREKSQKILEKLQNRTPYTNQDVEELRRAIAFSQL